MPDKHRANRVKSGFKEAQKKKSTPDERASPIKNRDRGCLQCERECWLH